eukprot:scaffold216278_cov14-Prasinocladus_malaysianus.AAC.1
MGLSFDAVQRYVLCLCAPDVAVHVCAADVTCGVLARCNAMFYWGDSLWRGPLQSFSLSRQSYKKQGG